MKPNTDIAHCPSLYPEFYLENDELKTRHIRALPSNDAYYFFPKGELIIRLNDKKPSRGLRRIFKIEFGEYTAYELDQLVRFHQLMETYQETNTIEFPSDWTEADNLRYLYSTNCNIPQALKDMIEHFNWRKETFPLCPSSKEIEILNLGFLYIYGRDKDFRPNIICQAIVFIEHEKEYTRDEWLRASCFLCEYAEKNLFLPGHVETWNMITNVRKARVLFLPSILKHVIQVMSNNYRARLYANFIIGMSATMRFLYKIICTFIDEVTVTKLKIIDDIHDGMMLQLINQDNFEAKFGGRSRDLEPGKDLYFPPMMPSDNFFLDTDKRCERLVTNEEYKEFYLQGKLNVVSPWFLRREEEEMETQRMQQRMIQEKEEKMKQTERMHNEFDDEVKDFNYESSEDTGLSKASNRRIEYFISEKSDSESFRGLNEFNNRKKQLNSKTPITNK